MFASFKLEIGANNWIASHTCSMGATCSTYDFSTTLMRKRCFFLLFFSFQSLNGSRNTEEASSSVKTGDNEQRFELWSTTKLHNRIGQVILFEYGFIFRRRRRRRRRRSSRLHHKWKWGLNTNSSLNKREACLEHNLRANQSNGHLLEASTQIPFKRLAILCRGHSFVLYRGQNNEISNKQLSTS